jgi:hypothetical protein
MRGVNVGGIAAEGTGDGGPAVSTTPHTPQNFSPCALGSPQAGQARVSGTPQAAENFRLSRLSWARAMQRIVVASKAVTGSVASGNRKKDSTNFAVTSRQCGAAMEPERTQFASTSGPGAFIRHIARPEPMRC